jgi:hypothetical protein
VLQTTHLKRHRMLLLLLLAASLASAICFAGCSRRQHSRSPARSGAKAEPPAPSKSPSTGKINAKFEKARLIWDDEKGRRVWDAEFEEATALQSDRNASVTLTGVKAGLYRDGKTASILIAPTVIADSRTREIRASGGVKIKSTGNGTSVSVDQLVWKSRDGRIIGSGGVNMVRDNVSIEANTLVADTSLMHAVLK